MGWLTWWFLRAEAEKDTQPTTPDQDLAGCLLVVFGVLMAVGFMGVWLPLFGASGNSLVAYAFLWALGWMAIEYWWKRRK